MPGGFLIRTSLKAVRLKFLKTSNRFSVLASNVMYTPECIYETPSSSEHFHIPIMLQGRNRFQEVTGMLDSGASTLFLNKLFVNKHKVTTQKLAKPIKVFNINGTLNKAGMITEVAVLNLEAGEHKEKAVFTVMDIGPENIIIGIDWLRNHNPNINWYKGIVVMDGCSDGCQSKVKLVELKLAPQGDTEVRLTASHGKSEKQRVKPKKVVRWADSMESFDTDSEPLLANGDRLFAMASYSTELAAAENTSKPVQTFEKMVPEHYRDFAKVFSDEESQQLPEHKPWDHTIELVSEAKGWRAKVFPLSKNEQEELDKFLDENLKKGYIRPSKSPMASSFFFVKKKDGGLRLVQDYRRLNEIMVKNSYPIPLITNLLDQLKGSRYFTKLDVRWGYNNICIKEDDEHKTAFITNRGLYKPTVMFFRLCNSPAMFQNVMNDIVAATGACNLKPDINSWTKT